MDELVLPALGAYLLPPEVRRRLWHASTRLLWDAAVPPVPPPGPSGGEFLVYRRERRRAAVRAARLRAVLGLDVGATAVWWAACGGTPGTAVLFAVSVSGAHLPGRLLVHREVLDAVVALAPRAGGPPPWADLLALEVVRGLAAGFPGTVPELLAAAAAAAR